MYLNWGQGGQSTLPPAFGGGAGSLGVNGQNYGSPDNLRAFHRASCDEP